MTAQIFLGELLSGSLWLTFFLCAGLAHAKTEFAAYRLVQGESVVDGGHRFGAHAHSLNYEAVSYKDPVYRKLAVLPFEDLASSADPVGLFRRVFNDYAMAMIVSLPESAPSPPSDLTNFHRLETFWTSLEIPIPVYFARHQDLSAAIGDSPVRLVLDKQPSNNLKQKLRLKTFSFRLDGTKAKTPTIGLFGFYDSFSLVPGLSTGRGNSTLSGVAALLHLAAKLRFLFEQNEQPEVAFEFVASASSSLDFEGTAEHFADVLGKDMVYALCLDSVFDARSLRLQTSKDLTGDARDLLSKLTTSLVTDLGAKQVIESVDVHKLIWQHNAIRAASRSTRAGTLTSLNPPKRPASLHEKYEDAFIESRDEEAIEQAIEVADRVAEILGSLAFPNYKVKQAFGVYDQLYSRGEGVKEFARRFGVFPRYAPFLSGESEAVAEFEREFRRVAGGRRVESYVQDIPEKAKYWVEAEPAQIQVLPLLPLLVDFYILLGTGVYLGLLWFCLKKCAN